jgi:potassium efflux system protein
MHAKTTTDAANTWLTLPRSLPRARLAVIAVACGIGVLATTQPCWAQTQPATQPIQETTPPIPSLKLETLQNKIKEIEAATNLDEPTKVQVLELYKTALTSLQESETFAARAATFAAQLDNAPKELEALKEALAKTAGTVEVPTNLKLTGSEQELAKAEAALRAAKEAEKRADEELKRPTLFAVEGPKQAAAAKKDLEQVRAELATAGAGETTSEQAQAQTVRLQVRELALQARIRALESELLFYNSCRELLAVRHDKAVRDSGQAERVANAWRDVVTEQRRAEAEAAKLAAERARTAAVKLNPTLEAILQRNAAVATEQAELAPKMQELTGRLREIEAELKLIRGKLDSVRDQAEAAQFSNAVGVLLRNERSQLPDIRQHDRQKALRQSKIADVQVKLIELQNERATARDDESEVQAILGATATSATEDDLASIKEQTHGALRDRRERLLALWHQYGEYLGVLVDLDVKQGQLIDEIEEFSDFVNERVFWTRSGPPLGVFTLSNAGTAARWLFDPVAATLTLDTLTAGIQRHVLTAGPALLVLLFLVLAQRKLRALLRANAERAAKPIHVAFADTLQAALWSFLLAVPWPLLLWIVAWRLATVPNAMDWSRAVAVGLAETARIFFPLLLLYHVCRVKGLAGAHFQWPTPAVRTVRRNLVWLMIVGLPMVFISAALEGQVDEVRKESLGRLAFLVEMCALSVFMYRILRRRGGVLQEVLARRPQGWLSRLRFIWQLAVIAAPLSLAVAASAGYHFTALQLATRLYWTLIVLAGAVILNAILLRWLLVARRRLAIAQAKERQAQRLAEKLATGETLGETAAVDTATDTIVDLSTVSQQSRQLVRGGVVFGFALSLWFVWSATLPALGVLDTVVIVGKVSLADVSLGVLVGLMTLIALRNLPGLLEMLLLQHLPLDGGARYACSAVSRYIITVTGIIIVFTLLGIGWSQVQWLVAAVTVGLGFGLQEIFANFVSGLILLFERPIRIGDTVTVGSVTGSVSRIRTRATTITDWDRKELIIPNKEFVTGQVVNWSLSDQVLRLVIKVGIAYGSDTQMAHDILMRVAKENPRVLEYPKPHAWFVAFGESSLDFELRAFVKDLDDWMIGRNALHMEIDKAFREAGIVIAFPQRDLHIRSTDPAIRLTSNGDGTAAPRALESERKLQEQPR